MKIDAVEIYYVQLPLIQPWRTAYGEDSAIDSVLVRLHSGSHDAWSETTPLGSPSYSPETAWSVFHIITEFLAPSVVGREFNSPSELLGTYSWVKGNPFAKAGLEIAWWMLAAKCENKPLHHLLGGNDKPVTAGTAFGVQDSLDILMEKIQVAFDRGFKRVKLKFKPGWGLEMLQAVRATFPDKTFHIDCNSAFTLNDLDMFKKVDKLGLAMIEQPLFHTDVHDHAELQKMIETPICLDESIKSVRDFELALKLGSCRYLNIKPGRVGGLSAAIELHRLSQEAGIPCWAGGMLESGVGVGILIEMATLPNFTYPNDIVPSDFFYNPDMVNPLVVINEDCTFTPSNCPGIPYEPDLELLKSRTVSRRVFETK